MERRLVYLATSDENNMNISDCENCNATVKTTFSLSGGLTFAAILNCSTEILMGAFGMTMSLCFLETGTKAENQLWTFMDLRQREGSKKIPLLSVQRSLLHLTVSSFPSAEVESGQTNMIVATLVRGGYGQAIKLSTGIGSSSYGFW